jgi:hypothetical protein
MSIARVTGDFLLDDALGTEGVGLTVLTVTAMNCTERERERETGDRETGTVTASSGQ